MSELARQACDACRADAPRITGDELYGLLQEVPLWELLTVDGVQRLQRIFTFADFCHAMAFTNLVGELAETAGHHPAIVTEWGKVTVSWWSHKIQGLHRNDFIMAARTDQLLAED